VPFEFPCEVEKVQTNEGGLRAQGLQAWVSHGWLTGMECAAAIGMQGFERRKVDFSQSMQMAPGLVPG